MDEPAYVCLTSISQIYFKSEFLLPRPLLKLLASLITLRNTVLKVFLGNTLWAVLLEK